MNNLFFFATKRFRPMILVATAAIGMVLTSGLACCQTDSQWLGGSGNWNDATNWNNSIPNGDFNAIVPPADSLIVQDIPGLQIMGLDLSGLNSELNLQFDLDVHQQIDWTDSKVTGNSSINLFGDGLLGEAILNSSLNNYGHITLTSFRGVRTTETAILSNKLFGVLSIDAGTVVGDFAGTQEATLHNEYGAKLNQVQSGSANYILWNVVNDGLIELAPGAGQFLFVNDFSQSPTGEIKLNGGTIDFFSGVDLSGKITGSGSISNVGSAEFDVAFIPGGSEIGSVQVAGGLSMTADTVTSMQIGANGTHDYISSIGGGFRLNGTLNIEALAGAGPGSYPLVGWNNSSGVADDGISLGQVPSGFEGALTFDASTMTMSLDVLTVDEVVDVEAFQVVRGSFVAGDLSSLAVSDDNRLEIERDATQSRAPIAVQFESELNNDSPASLKLVLESSVGFPGTRMSVRLFNFQTNRFEVVLVDASSGTDSTVTVEAPGDVLRFVEPGTARVKARVVVLRRGVIRRNWKAKFDKVVWATGN